MDSIVRVLFSELESPVPLAVVAEHSAHWDSANGVLYVAFHGLWPIGVRRRADRDSDAGVVARRTDSESGLSDRLDTADACTREDPCRRRDDAWRCWCASQPTERSPLEARRNTLCR